VYGRGRPGEPVRARTPVAPPLGMLLETSAATGYRNRCTGEDAWESLYGRGRPGEPVRARTPGRACTGEDARTSTKRGKVNGRLLIANC